MSERATAYSIPPQATTPSPGNELAVRPKVLRRPAHFNAKTTMIESPAPVLVPVQFMQHTAEKPTPVFRAWQDDGKFAVTLLGIIIVVNLLVSTWLAAISPAKTVATSAAPVTAAASASSVHVLDTNVRDISEQ